MDDQYTAPDTIEAEAYEERVAVIRLIKAHAADCERRGARMLANGYTALVSEIEDAMQHDSAHVEELEGGPQTYRYRGIRMPNPNAWHVSGADMGPEGGAGVLAQPENGERLLDICGECAGMGGYDGSCVGCGGTGMVEG